MFSDITAGRFSPDLTRSGSFPQAEPRGQASQAESESLTSPTSPLDDSGDWSHVTASAPPLVVCGPSEQDAGCQVSDSSDTDDADGNSESDESEAEKVILDLATSERPTGSWHPGYELYQLSTCQIEAGTCLGCFWPFLATGRHSFVPGPSVRSAGRSQKNPA